MGEFFNPDNLGFQYALNSKIYVDKTMLIENTNSVINTNDRYVCVSRPRRFGKSITAEMLVSYYSRGCDSKDMFQDLKISKASDFERHLNKYNVFHLNMDLFLTKSKNIESMISTITSTLIKEVKEAYPEFKNARWRDLEEACTAIFKETKIPFIFIIDEWDCVLREYQKDKEKHKEYLEFLKLLFKDKKYLALAYMTGILPIKKYGKHSALNMFTEISMIEPDEYAEFTGFTEEEVKVLCKKYNMCFEDIKKWYNGYDLMGISTYNPRSVVMSLNKHRLGDFWTSTETYEALTKYIEMNFDGLKDAIALLIAGQKVKVVTNSFTNDMVTFNSKHDILTLLIHLGYLTYNYDTQEAWIPNNEILKQFATTIEDLSWLEVSKALLISDELLKATLACDGDKVAQLIDVAHSDNTSILKYNDENSLACVISIAYYSARRHYDIYRELPAGKGYADLVFVPRKNVDMPAMIVELKYDKSADTAIKQIKDRNYSNGLKDYHGEVLIVGINYNKDDITKKHSCKIEKLTK